MRLVVEAIENEIVELLQFWLGFGELVADSPPHEDILGVVWVPLEELRQFEKMVGHLGQIAQNPHFVLIHPNYLKHRVFRFFHFQFEHRLTSLEVNVALDLWVLQVDVVAVSDVFFSLVLDIVEVENRQKLSAVSHSQLIQDLAFSF